MEKLNKRSFLAICLIRDVPKHKIRLQKEER